MNAIHAFLPQLLIAFHAVEGASDMDAYINRIRESGRALRQLIVVSTGTDRLAEGRPRQDSATTSGVSTLPNGRAYYNARLANQTTTTLTADEIHAIGLSEVARLRAEMLAIKDEVGFKGDLPAFFAELRDKKDNPLYYYPDTDAGRQAYLTASETTRRQSSSQSTRSYR